MYGDNAKSCSIEFYIQNIKQIIIYSFFLTLEKCIAFSEFGVEENISSYSDGGQHRSPAVSGESTNSDTLGVGSVVEVVIGGKICYGVIKWIGKVPLRGDSDVKSQMAGIELVSWKVPFCWKRAGI